MSKAQARSIDAWSYYQARSTKEAIVESSLENLQQSVPATNTALIKKYQDQLTPYEKEKSDIKAHAKGFQKQYDDINLFDDQFDMTEALLTISIAMFGITSLAQKNWLLYFSAAISVVVIVLGLTAFMNISLHSDFVSRILG